VSVPTPALLCDGQAETKSDAGCEWYRQIQASVSLAKSCSETGVQALEPKVIVTVDFFESLQGPNKICGRGSSVNVILTRQTRG